MKKIFTKEASPSKREALKSLIKSGAPRIFEREPAPAFAEGELDKLVDKILEVCQ